MEKIPAEMKLCIIVGDPSLKEERKKRETKKGGERKISGSFSSCDIQARRIV
jgi:hypothetical protein